MSNLASLLLTKYLSNPKILGIWDPIPSSTLLAIKRTIPLTHFTFSYALDPCVHEAKVFRFSVCLSCRSWHRENYCVFPVIPSCSKCLTLPISRASLATCVSLNSCLQSQCFSHKEIDILNNFVINFLTNARNPIQ